VTRKVVRQSAGSFANKTALALPIQMF